VPSALVHAFVFSRCLIFAATLCSSTNVQALGAATSAGAREGEARSPRAAATASPLRASLYASSARCDDATM
jgi:hypothetical protein